MPYSRSNSYGVEWESDFEKCHDHCRMHDPCRPRIQMFIDDNDRVRSEEESADNDWRQENMGDENYNQNCQQPMTHTHELLGSVEIAEREEDPHNHRWATVTSPAIPCGRNDHFHEVKTRTDFYEDHFHEIIARTGGAIWVGDRHVHFLMGMTTVAEGHQHDYRAATMIDDPIGE